MSSLKKQISIPGLIDTVYQSFCNVLDPRESIKSQRKSSPIKDHLMAGLAVFGLKCPSLLDFDKTCKDPVTACNLRNLYHVDNPPSDTYMRERLDEVDPIELRPAFTELFAIFQKGNGIEEFAYIDGGMLVSVDGTGLFSSSKTSCPHCCQKHHSNGQITYYHQMLGACIVHPDKKNVIPLCPEVILNQDGSKKNDCERNAAKRFLESFRREHPKLKVIILEDGLSANAPNIRLLEEHHYSYILVAHITDHKYLFEQLEESEKTVNYESKENGVYHQFRFINGVSLNKSNKDLKVNVLEYRCTDVNGKEYNCSWVTDIMITIANVLRIAKAGRARWKIENETFNTLKNLGDYNLERNYGHGKKYLSTNFCMIMMLAFLIDQIQDVCCEIFRKCKKISRTYRNLWQHMRTLFRYVYLSDWEMFYKVIAREISLNTS